MNLKEKIAAKLKQIFEAQSALENYANATTEAGVEIYWEGELVEGVAVTIAGEGEEMVAAPEGDHQVVVDGMAKIVTLDANGVVVAIKDAEVVEEIEAETNEDFANEIAEEMAAIKAENQALKAQIAEFEKSINEVKADVAEFKKQFPTETKKETKFGATKTNPFVNRFVNK